LKLLGTQNSITFAMTISSMGDLFCQIPLPIGTFAPLLPAAHHEKQGFFVTAQGVPVDTTFELGRWVEWRVAAATKAKTEYEIKKYLVETFEAVPIALC
jgi:hypothetical protein